MSKEYIWKMTVDGESRVFKCLVEEDACILFEDDVQTKTLKIKNKEVAQGVLQIDSVVEIWGDKYPFQLERNIPYIKVEGKWAMSDTSRKDRIDKYIYNTKVAAIVQGVIAVIMCAACGIKYLLTKELGNWWFILVLASVMALSGVIQYTQTKKDLKEVQI